MTCGIKLEARRNADFRVTFTPASRKFTFSGMVPLFSVRLGDVVLLQVGPSATPNGSNFVVAGDSVVLTIEKADMALLDSVAPDTSSEVLFFDVTLTDGAGFENWLTGGPFILLGLNDVTCGGCNSTIEVSLGGQCVSVNIEGGNISAGANIALGELNEAVNQAQSAATDAETAESSARGYSVVSQFYANEAAASAAEAASFAGGINKGEWDADLNVPPIVSGVGVNGEFYTVSVPGLTEIDGITDWRIGEQIVFGSGLWKKQSLQLSLDGSNIAPPDPGVSPSGAVPLRSNQNMFFVTPEDFGAVSNDPTFDNTSAITDAETAATATGVSVLFKEGADYYFKGTLVGTRNRLTWTGRRTRLIYNGASTTRNLLQLGNGTNQMRDAEVSGIEICTLTLMTSPSCAVYARRLVRSNLWFENLQGQDFLEANPSFRLWHGIWFDQTDNVRLYCDAINAQGDGLRVNGALGTSGPKADLFVHVGKISGGQNGVLMGGGFGGLYLLPDTTMIRNNINLRVDQSLCAERNRELFCTGSIFDVALGSNGSSDANVIIDDPGDLRINFGNVWVSAGQSHGIWVKRLGGRMTFAGGRINGNSGDAIRTDASGQVMVSCVQINDNAGWGLNPRVSGTGLIYSCCWFGANTLGSVNPAFPSASVGRNGTQDFSQVNTTRVEADTGDYLNYDRTSNIWESFNGGVSNFAWGANAFRSGASNPFIRYGEYPLASAPSGAISVVHGDSNMPRKGLVVQGVYNDGGVTRSLTFDSIGPSGFNFAANANAVGKPVVAFVWYLDQPRTW